MCSFRDLPAGIATPVRDRINPQAKISSDIELLMIVTRHERDKPSITHRIRNRLPSISVSGAKSSDHAGWDSAVSSSALAYRAPDCGHHASAR